MAKRNAEIKIKVENLPGILGKIEVLTAERDAAGAERERYRAAWKSARRRAKATLDDAAETASELNAAWALIDEWATRQCITGYRIRNDSDSDSECLHCAAAQMTYAINGEDTDPGCPWCGDLYDPDQPNLHARCRRIPDAEARRDGRE